MIEMLRRVANIQPFLDDLEAKRVNKFQEKIKEDDEKGALQDLQECASQRAGIEIIEMLRVAVNSRKNDLITNLLHHTENRQEDCVDTTDYRHPMCNTDFFQNAVLYSTLNDDPETLEAVLEWGTNNNQEASEDNRSLLIALLENYTQCIGLLYRFGYKIRLPDEDEESIASVLNMKNAVDSTMDTYYSAMKQKDDQTCPSPKFKYDSVERFLRFKASSNPQYLSTEFIEYVEMMKKELKLLDQQEKLKQVDPIVVHKVYFQI